MHPKQDPSWQHYAETILRFEGDIIIDLRVPASDNLVSALQSLDLSAPFAVITACNPRGRVVGVEENQDRTKALRSDLENHGLRCVPISGESVDSKHIEPGFAVATSLSEARAVARSFEQSAFFRFDGRTFWIEPALALSEPIRLPIQCDPTNPQP